MKRLLAIIISLILMILVFSACSTITGGSSENNDPELYKAAIERYFSSVLQADTDALLDCLDPLGSLYPSDETITELREVEDISALPGEVIVEELIVLEESGTRALVDTTLFMRVDFDGDGEFVETKSYPTFELTFSDGKWRIYNFSFE